MKEYISIKALADFHQLDEKLLLEVATYEIVPVKRTRKEVLLNADDLEEFERALRLYHELEVNLQGVEIICRMHRQIEELQQELARLRDLLE